MSITEEEARRFTGPVGAVAEGSRPYAGLPSLLREGHR